MEEPTIPHPPIMPQANVPEVHGPVPENLPVERVVPATALSLKKFKLPPWVLIGGIILILVVGSIIFGSTQMTQTEETQTATPTATPSATSSRALSSIASQSAFAKFETDLEALTKGLQNTQIQNQQLLPPRLELPLGF